MNQNFFNLEYRKKHDILSELLAGKPTEGMISKKELNALNRLIAGAVTGSPPVGKISRPTQTVKIPAVRNKAMQKKRKVTYYVSQEIINDLDRVIDSLRSQMPEHLHPTLSKSSIVNEALAITLHEFAAKGKDSRLLYSLMKNS